MTAYSDALKAYFEPAERTQEALATAIGKPQPTVNRYANDERFPNAEIARAIDKATNGAVPFELWQRVAMERFGIGEAA